ncbi:MAG TPA: CoA transferase [Acidimicrobiia bacterium]|nr:CoA transferase [Acidimicrobiia bacterium]
MTAPDDTTPRTADAEATDTGARADARSAWAGSGAMVLTGRTDEPPLEAPDGFVDRLRAIGELLGRRSEELGRRVDVDVLALLGERAALARLRRGGDVSCGGSARLLQTADGWLAVNLPRPDDLDLLPAWLVGTEFPSERSAPVAGPGSVRREGDPERITHRKCGQSARAAAEARPGPEVWGAVAAALAMGATEPLAERAQLLGLPVAALPERPLAVPVAAGPLAGLPVTATRVADVHPSGPGWPAGVGQPEAGSVRGLEGLLVADLSSLWAGPLCTHLLQQAGARVVKVESVHRPDGARNGPAAFFDLLHGGQEAVAIDFRHEDGRSALRRLLAAADVVVEASRPRALEQLGIVAETLLAEAVAAGRHWGVGPRVWVSITGYGRGPDGRDRVAFGDDAAAAGGLVVWDDAGPCFVADAVADPCAGLVAAAAVLSAVADGGRWLLDVSMRDVAAHLAGPSAGRPAIPNGARPAPQPTPAEADARRAGEREREAQPPRARATSGRGPAFGEHTEAVLADLRVR